MFKIYLDNAATTAITPDVLNAMMPYLTNHYANPSSIYSFANESKMAIEKARASVAKSLGATEREIFFTGCGTESNNWAIKGVARKALKSGKNHIISTAFEHHAVLHTLDTLKKEGFEITLLPVSSEGLIDPKQVADAITDKTCLVSIMYANNEIGTIQPISEIGKICREKGVLFHTDAVQAFGNIRINVEDQNIDLLTVSGDKIHAPKGVGALYIKKGITFDNLIDGGGQERGKRAGTENVASIVGFGVAAEIANQRIDRKNYRLSAMRDRIIKEILKIERSHLNGDKQKRLCTNINISFEGIEGESMLILLDLNGICASSGSACTSGSLDPSHVLLSIGRPHEIAHGSLRLSLSEETTDAEIDKVLELLPPIIEKLRAMSPLWERIKSEER